MVGGSWHRNLHHGYRIKSNNRKRLGKIQAPKDRDPRPVQTLNVSVSEWFLLFNQEVRALMIESRLETCMHTYIS